MDTVLIGSVEPASRIVGQLWLWHCQPIRRLGAWCPAFTGGGIAQAESGARDVSDCAGGRPWSAWQSAADRVWSVTRCNYKKYGKPTLDQFRGVVRELPEAGALLAARSTSGMR